jgi:hypothetical protein
VADLPARGRLQLARLPRRLDVDGGRGHRRQDPRDLLPDHGLRRHGLRPRRGEHVLHPAAIFAGIDGITWWDALHNWIFAFIGNLVGAAVFVAGSYWYLYARDAEQQPGAADAGDQPASSGDSGRFSGNGTAAADAERSAR